jgi:hypothetical protein
LLSVIPYFTPIDLQVRGRVKMEICGNYLRI